MMKKSIKPCPVGRIEYYYGPGGTVVERCEFANAAEFIQKIKENSDCGVPMHVVVYTDEKGNKIDFPEFFFSNLNPCTTKYSEEVLVQLQCAIGDTVYRICPKCSDTHNGSCSGCAWLSAVGNRGCDIYGLWKDGQYPPEKCHIVPYKVAWNYIPNLMEHIGKTVFLTEKEAEDALAKAKAALKADAPDRQIIHNEPPYTVTEVCPHCENEIEMRWSTEAFGFKAFCPVCGKRLMLCDECRHSNCGECDYDSRTDTCKHNNPSPKKTRIRLYICEEKEI